MSITVLTTSLILVAALFPPLNWPDEKRNVFLLERGDYGLLYGPFQRFWRALIESFGSVGAYDELAKQSSESPGWRYFDGALRYATVPGDGNFAYYSAKSANIILILAFVAIFAVLATLTKGRARGISSTVLLVTALSTPAVVYQSLQVSTDLLFILMSVSLFFVETKRFQVGFAALAFVLVLEDRSFAILGFTALLYATLPLVIRWQSIARRPVARVTLLLGLCGLGIVLGRVLSTSLLRGNSDWIQRLSSVPGFADVSGSIQYTQLANYSLPVSPILGLAGLVYLPSAAEFFLLTTPLYVLGGFVAWRMAGIAVRNDTRDGARFFYLLAATLLVFFAVTGATHVFESGRYYFTMTPLLVLSLAEMLRGRRDPHEMVANPGNLGAVAGVLLTTNCLVTLVVAAGAILTV
ncbi:MAG: hypothetical protein ABF306_03755 [Nocardioides marinisabuli]|uniref:hypothetical protein n=1 Tax=Nocardioides marinisabuli TaxID=419476 RepID=UPI00321BF691